MAGSKIAGTCYVKVDSIQLTLAGSVTVSPFTVLREGLAGLSGPACFKETPRIPSIEVEVFADRDFSMEDMQGVTEATVTAELANGRTFTLFPAYLAGEPDINAAEGTVTLRFEGENCEES